jgi:hypothetical protein
MERFNSKNVKMWKSVKIIGLKSHTGIRIWKTWLRMGILTGHEKMFERI